MSDHAKFSPSSAHRWIPCAGSMALEGALPEGRTSSKYADEGTVAHDVAAACLQDGANAEYLIGAFAEVTPTGKVNRYLEVPHGTPSASIFTVDQEMAGYVQVYLDYVRSWVAKGYLLLVEQKVEFSDTIGVPNQFGTSDTILVSEDGAHVVVIDLKYGMGVKVYAEMNHQMLSYAVGTVETFGSLGDFERMTLVVCQPRLDHIDEWETDIGEVRLHGVKMACSAYAAQEAIAKHAMGASIAEFLVPGEKTCQWCKAKANCPALLAKVAEAVYDDFQALDDAEAIPALPEPSIPGPERIGAVYNQLASIEQFCSAVRAEVERMVFAGITVVGIDGQPLRLAEGRKGHRAWVDEAVAEGVLVGLLPPEKAYAPRKIITPSAADKLLNKKKTAAMWQQLQDLIFAPPGNPKVVLGSSDAPPYVGEAKAEEFSDFGELAE